MRGITGSSEQTRFCTTGAARKTVFGKGSHYPVYSRAVAATQCATLETGGGG